MRFVGNGDQKHRFMRTIVIVGYIKEFAYLLDKYTAPFYSCFGIYCGQITGIETSENCLI